MHSFSNPVWFRLSYLLLLLIKKLPVLLLVFPAVCLGTGWNDYSLDIGDGYRIIRVNSFDKGLEGTNGVSIFPHSYREIGPLSHYYKDSNFIFVKSIGWKKRNLFEGDTFKDQDPSKEYYFIIRINNGVVSGPSSYETFSEEIKTIGIESVPWVYPTNPNFWTPLMGGLMFIGLAIPILYLKFWYATFPFTIGLVYLLLKWKQKRHNKILQRTHKTGVEQRH